MEEKLEILRKCGFSANLPDAVLREMARIGVEQQHPAHTVIQLEGEPAEAMYVLSAGLVKISRVAASGREQVMNVITPGGHFNTVPIFDGGPCPANAETLTAT